MIDVTTYTRDECAALLAAVAARLCVLSAPSSGDEALDVKAAAKRIGVSADWLARESRPGGRYAFARLDTGSRRLAFSRAAIEAWQRADLPALAVMKAKPRPAPSTGIRYEWQETRRGRAR